ncbi:CSC1-like protein 1 [Orchesella cincta]|uniref:CSC1-like protein 1 n=1 Tax=Orchesella cincta TaxID=48709 RepID=A0A1D2N2K3_ORCCI|nr:CSC1-like protein 1 [Orchesella cincta]
MKHEIYPQAEITEISFAYDISKLQSIEFRRLGAASAKLYCEEKMEKTNRRPTIRPYLCGVVGCGCKRCKETDAIEYYGEIERKLKEEIDVERERAIEFPLGIAFVTFTTAECATACVDDHAWSAKVCLHTPRSRHAKELNSRQWIVRLAPLPEDILWANLSLDYKMWYVKCLGINLVLLLLVAVCTTPVWVFSLLSGPQNGTITPNAAAAELPFLAGVIVDTLPTMLICIIGVGLIALVSTSDTFVRYWTKTAGNLSEMLKIFVFLTFMVVVLPSLGVTSLSYIVHRQKLVRWSCIFYKENGVLFVNYVCTSTFVGTAAELLRLPELFVYAIKLGFARSAAELGSVRKSVLWDFQIGANYAWMLLHFAIFTCFSVIYPLVTPFGMAYLVMKHWVDRYNIYFVYAPCKVEKDIHFHIGHQEDPTATIKPDVRALQLVALIAFCVTTALFLGQMCFNACADFSPIHHFRSIKEHAKLDDDDATTSQDDVREIEQTTSNEKPGDTIHTLPQNVEATHNALPDIVVHSDLHISSETDHLPGRVSIGSSGNSGSGGSGEKFVGRYIPPLLRPEFIKLHNIHRARSADDLHVPDENSKEGLSNSEGEDEILKSVEVKLPTHGPPNKH